MTDVDLIVVGAGPAGSAAAILAARAGLSVVVLERGPFPGSKNMYGGVVYGRILDTIIPNWWEEAPIQRWVTRRSTLLMTETQSLSVDYRTTAWGEAPYNGATTYRPDFDNWLAGHASEAGADIVCSTTATGLIREGGRVVGVRTDRPNGDIRAKVVIAADGVNSFLAKEAGMYTHDDPEHFTLGVKETIALAPEVICERFGVSGREGADFEIVGCTQGIPGGGFLYTNYDSVSIGVVLQLPGLAAQQQRPEEILAGLKNHHSMAPYLAGGELKEYSAHLIPEGGYHMMPELACDGMMVVGDAAAMCLAAGIWLEGVNFAIGSGLAAAQTAVAALRSGDTSASGLSGYQQRMESNFVLKDHKSLADVPGLIMSPRVQQQYPQMICNIAERMFTVENPAPKPGVNAILRSELKASGVRMRDLVKDAVRGLRSYG
jgi:electron transfer flavoprotein-quinone oxidoreductase